MNVKVNGWTYDPAEQAWTAKTGPNTWSIVKGDLDDPPSWSPGWTLAPATEVNWPKLPEGTE